MRRVRNPKRLINSVSGDPHDSIQFVDDERHGVPPPAIDFAVHEKVLQLFLSANADRPKSVAGLAIRMMAAAPRGGPNGPKWAELGAFSQFSGHARLGYYCGIVFLQYAARQ